MPNYCWQIDLHIRWKWAIHDLTRFEGKYIAHTFIRAFESLPVHCLKFRPWWKRLSPENGGTIASLYCNTMEVWVSSGKLPNKELNFFESEPTFYQYHEVLPVLLPLVDLQFQCIHISTWPNDLWMFLWSVDVRCLESPVHEYLHEENHLWRAKIRL